MKDGLTGILVGEDAPGPLAAMRLMLQQPEPDDYVIGTGETHTVREFCEVAFQAADLNYRDHVRIDAAFVRPAELDLLLGDATKARRVLGWEPACSFNQLVLEMVQHDIDLLTGAPGTDSMCAQPMVAANFP